MRSKTNEKIKIEKAIPEDALGITTVLYKTWLDTYPNEEIGITREDVEESYKESFTDEKIKSQQQNIANAPQNQLRLVAKIGDQVVGVSTMIRNENNNQLRTIYVLTEFQGKGIGNMLWREAKKFCDPAKDTIVQVATYNKKAISFYEKLGFVDTGKRWSDPKWKMKSGATIPEMELVIKAGVKKDWQEYYEITKNKPPTKLLIKALDYVANKGRAIDIGGGALKDTRFLLEQGFDVTVVDKSDLMAKEAEAVKSDKLHYFISSFADFNFPKSEYDIASAMYSLPFNPPESFETVFKNIKDSLVKGGVFCGQCFGVKDEWSANQKMTFHTKEQVENLLSDMEVILLDEEEKDDKTANGTPKHWHVFHFIAKKL